MSKLILKNIEEHLKEEKSKLVIMQVVSALDAQRDLELPTALKAKLDSVKNNPLDATEVKLMQDKIDKMVADGELDISEAPVDLLEAIMTSDELSKLHKDGVTLAEFYKLGTAIAEKVFSLKYLNDEDKLVYKEPDSHKEMKVLSFYERKEVRKLSKKIVSIGNKNAKLLQEAYATKIDVTEDNFDEKNKKMIAMLKEVKDNNEKAEKATKELDELAMRYSGLDKKNFSTQWEEDLAIAKVLDMAEDHYVPPLGKN